MNTNTIDSSKETTTVISPLLATLLNFSKTEFLKDATAFEEVTNIKKVLGPLYSYDMKAKDIARVVLIAYTELIKEPRFQVSSSDVTFNIMMAPIETMRRQTMFTEKAFDFDNIAMSMLDICYSYIMHMLTEMMLSNIGWCRDQVFKPMKADVHVGN